MAGAISAFSEAFSSYRHNIAGYLAYSVLLSLCTLAVLGIISITTFVAGALSIGSAPSLSSSGGGLSFALVSIGATVLAALVGAAVALWLLSGIKGAYIESVNSFVSGKKPSIRGFFAAIPRRATPMFLYEILMALVLLVPALIITSAASLAANPLVSIAGTVVAGAFQIAIALLLVFGSTSVVLDSAGAIRAAKNSVSRAGRNMLQVIIYAVIAAVVAAPIAAAVALPLLIARFTALSANIPAALLILGLLFSLAYAFLFAAPVCTAALISLYRRAK